MWIFLPPRLDSLHGRFFQRQLAALHQQPSDGFIGMAVLFGISYPHDFAIFELYPARTLDLQEK